jgi:hypothetical protein
MPSIIYLSSYDQITRLHVVVSLHSVKKHKLSLIWASPWKNQHNGFASSMDSDQPAHPRSLIRIHAVRYQFLYFLGFVSEQHGSWSDCTDAQVGLDPCWSQTHYVGFVVTRLIFTFFPFRLGFMSHQHSIGHMWLSSFTGGGRPQMLFHNKLYPLILVTRAVTGDSEARLIK